MRAAAPLLLLALLVPTPALARPPYKQALGDLLGDDLPARMRGCQACHLAPKGGDDEDRPHNHFGLRLKELRSQRRKAGLKTDITARMLAALDEDADRDGVSNGAELYAGTSPGDPAQRPDAATAGAASEKLKRWLAVRAKTYPWQPFEPVQRPAVPAGNGWARNPVDAFLAAEHQKHGLTPRPEAPRAVLLRRLHLDLVGLPPTREEIQAFEEDRAADAYERVVDRLLNSPRYGERWGRHWMDVWRYADWAGYGAEVRDSQKHVWRWRDWIIESLNRDKGYARMVQEMLAADELAPTDPDALRATGFLVRNWYLFNRNVWLDRTVEHTGKAFLGVTFNCARCHDHFYDPIRMQDYYALRAVFEPHLVRTDAVPGVSDPKVDGLVRVYDGQPAAPTYVFERGDEARPDKTRTIPPAVPPSLGGALTVAPVALPREAYQPEKRAFVVEQATATTKAASETASRNAEAARRLAAAAFVPVRLTTPLSVAAYAATVKRAELQLNAAERERDLARARHEELLAVLKAEQLDDAGKANTPEGAAAARRAAAAQDELALQTARQAAASAELAHFLAALKARPAAEARLKTARTQLAAREKAKPAAAYQKRKAASYPATSTGRRLALARWITDRQNPLAARVAVNHVWLRHLGRGLVTTEFDFGKNGQPPTHPALLDWLAAEFMDSGWSMKHLHRLIVTSAAYRMDSAASPEMLAKDPDNRHYWRMNPRRMEGEVIRDSLLALAGKLDTTMGGPDIDHHTGLTVPRRSLYFRHAAEKQMEFLLLFDAASVNECYRRTESIIPQQALALSNSTLATGMSRLVAKQLGAEVGTGQSGDADFVRAAFAHVLGRAASEREQAVCGQFLKEQMATLADPTKLTPFDTGVSSTVPPAKEPHLRARENLILAILNLNEFVTIR